MAVFLETNEAAPYSFAYRLRANPELCRQFICRIFVERHTSSQSFANAASLFVSEKPSTPQASAFG